MDITERKQLEAQVRQKHKMEAIGTLAGGIAHEFNNMLGAILGFTELTLDEVPRASTASQHLQEVLTAGKRAKNLVQQILAFSRQREPTREPVELRLLVAEVLSLLRPSLPTTVEIRPHLPREMHTTVLADVTQMHQVVMNLCTNAEQAMRETGGVLEVGLDTTYADASFAQQHPEVTPGPYVRLTVRDTGHGMPPEVLERIFEPFFTTKEVGKGTGIGLAVVHGIVTNHGGAITVDSQPGRGTTFTVYLPQVAGHAAAEEPAEAARPRAQKRILFVDDETALVRWGQAVLGRLGYEVVGCTSSEDAFNAFQAAPHRFDLVITDQTMPHMTGEQLAEACWRVCPDIPVILCTGYSHVIDAQQAAAQGIRTFLMKPLMSQDLDRAIKDVFAQCTAREP
jgi:nitrogen-specific signal transduction histidine kinase/CheY-like chemotaxis protein